MLGVGLDFDQTARADLNASQIPFGQGGVKARAIDADKSGSFIGRHGDCGRLLLDLLGDCHRSYSII